MNAITKPAADHLALVRPSREIIIARAKHLRGEIEQMFIDAAHWNSINPDKPPVDPDPDGKMRQIADGLDKMLAAELVRNAFHCLACGYQGPCYGTATGSGVTAPACKNCGRNDELERMP